MCFRNVLYEQFEERFADIDIEVDSLNMFLDDDPLLILRIWSPFITYVQYNFTNAS